MEQQLIKSVKEGNTYELVYNLQKQCYSLSSSYRVEFTIPDELVETTTNPNDPACLIVRGIMFKHGYQVERNSGKARTRFRKAWKLLESKNDSIAHYLRGVMLQYGFGITKDSISHHEQYLLAIEKGLDQVIPLIDYLPYGMSKERFKTAFESAANRGCLNAIFILIISYVSSQKAHLYMKTENYWNLTDNYRPRYLIGFLGANQEKYNKYFKMALSLEHSHTLFVAYQELLSIDIAKAIKCLKIASIKGHLLAKAHLKNPVYKAYIEIIDEHTNLKKAYEDLRVNFDAMPGGKLALEAHDDWCKQETKKQNKDHCKQEEPPTKRQRT